MKDLGTVLKDFQEKHPEMSNGQLAQALEAIQADADIRNFWQENQGQLQPDALTVSVMDLYEFVVQKSKQNDPKSALYPGYFPVLTLEKGYPHVAYQADEATQKALLQKKHLQFISVPKDVRQADLKAVIAAGGDRGPAVPRTVQLFDALASKHENQSDNFVPGLYLYGDFGVGKTYLMGALANALSANGISVAMIHWTSMIEQLKASFNRNSDDQLDDILDQAKNVEVLILDDMGTDNLSAWSRDSILSVILEYRMQNELTTCFTSNFDLNSLEEYLGQTKDGKEPGKAARLMQRFLFLAQPVAMVGKNLRLQR